jgi:HAD superfamily hydrolase (TIGR01490 family)
VALAIFDLDNTLIANDSDYLWGQFLVDQGIVNQAYYENRNAEFYEDYKHGRLDIVDFLRFSLKPLADNPPELLYRLRRQFIETIIKPLLLTPAQQLIAKHKAKGDTVLVITATNRFVTQPIVELYGIEHLLATTPEYIDGRYTGNFVGVPCFQQGKVTLLQDWLQTRQENMNGSWFYTDSHNDLPLLNQVTYPVAVDPDAKLAKIAQSRQWPIISLRGDSCPEIANQ